MLQETVQEDLVSQCHRSLFVVMSVVLPAERDMGVSEIDEPVIGDCDPMCTSGQIVQNVFGTAEGAFRINHPFFAKQSPQKFPEGELVRQRKAGAMERELVPAERPLQASHKLASKDAA
jgi:hypothetical protein